MNFNTFEENAYSIRETTPGLLIEITDLGAQELLFLDLCIVFKHLNNKFWLLNENLPNALFFIKNQVCHLLTNIYVLVFYDC